AAVPPSDRDALLRMVHLSLARCRFEEKRPVEALAELNQAIDADAAPEPWLLKAHVHEQLKQPKEALECYRAILRTAPGSADASEAIAALVRLEKEANRGAHALPYVRAYSAAAQD